MDTEDTMDERRLVRLLHGELAPEEAAALRREVARDPGAARRLAELGTTWEALELPAPRPAPSGFAGRVAALAAEEDAERRAADAAPLGPAWARAVAGAALILGLTAGATLASLAGGAGGGEPVGASGSGEAPDPAAVAWKVPFGSGEAGIDWAGTDAVPSSLAETYWSALTGGEASASGASSGESGGGGERR